MAVPFQEGGHASAIAAVHGQAVQGPFGQLAREDTRGLPRSAVGHVFTGPGNEHGQAEGRGRNLLDSFGLGAATYEDDAPGLNALGLKCGQAVSQ